jgi:hypothetical protein
MYRGACCQAEMHGIVVRTDIITGGLEATNEVAVVESNRVSQYSEYPC